MSREFGQAVLPPAELRLPPRAESVREARRFLRDLLRGIDRERWTDAAELALSEVVTNGVLHAHTDLTVRITVDADLLTVEVSDGSPALPVQRGEHSPEATTGRGLELVAALTRDCGVRPEPNGKVVWFHVSDDEPAEPTEEDLLAAWDHADWQPEGDWQAPAAADQTEVVLQRLPTALWLAAREHHQALLRELVLYVAEHEDVAGSLPDIALVDRTRQLIWTGLLAEIDRTREEGTARRPVHGGHSSQLSDVPASVDLPLRVPADLLTGFSAMQDALDVGERLAVADRLLVRPGLPEIVAVRDWLCEQVVAQLAGVPASPWPGADQSYFTDLVHDRADPQPPQWDTSLVTASDRGVAAADDANRIIAISPSLADALGWDPAELVGRRVVALIPPELREAHVAGFSRHLTTGESHIMGVTLQLPVLHRDGSSVPCTFLIEQAEVGRGRPVYLAWIEPV